LGHWKAQFNLAGLYLRGQGVDQDVDKALALTEDLMSKGVPAAWDNMGAYYMGGVGPLKQDATVAYAFWQRAADMGSMAAQAYLGEKLLGTYDDPPSFWGNRDIGLKMLECAYAQGSAKGAFELGLTLDNSNKEYSRAIQVLHDGVKFGSKDAAGYLFGAFDDGDALVGERKDRARAERYKVLADALWRNPALRFPNLDKVLPLPPAQLPKWDGNKQTLIDDSPKPSSRCHPISRRRPPNAPAAPTCPTA
jgi:TPR repeat protein